MTKENADVTAKKERVIGTPFPKGVSGNPAGRPKGSFSITTKIKQHLEEHPEVLEDIIKDIFKKHPDLVWKMVDGQPKSNAPEINIDKAVIFKWRDE